MSVWTDLGGAWCYRLLDAEVLLRHQCTPLQQYNAVASEHRKVALEPLTLIPSVVCDGCGAHGFICEGKWQPC